MSSAPVYLAFHDKLVAAWTTTPLVFENEVYDLPDTPAPFVYVEIYGDDLNQETFGAPGANQWLEQGWAYLHVMTPSGGGTTLARTYADTLVSLFREQPLISSKGTIMMPEMSIGSGDPGKDFPNYWAFTVAIHWNLRTTTGG